MRTLVINNRRDVLNGNLGDCASDPTLYFPWLRDAKRVQLDRIGAWVIPIPDLGRANIILGGGGLLETTLAAFGWGIYRILDQADPRHLIVWGAGMNTHGNGGSNVPEYLDDFKLVGLRDTGCCHRWVPCPSVMLPELRQEYKVTREAVIYDNWQFPWQTDTELPRMKNNRRFRSAAAKRRAVTEVIAFLGSAEVVLTSAYHGVLWATLLGKKVVVTRPFSSKFSHFRHPPVVLREGEDWREAAERAITYPHALEECREVTQQFAREVREVLGL